MNLFRFGLTAMAVAMLVTLVPVKAKADEWNKQTTVTFNQPVEVPGMVLPAGTYLFRRISSVDPNAVEITGTGDTPVDAILLSVPEYRTEPTDHTVITFEERPDGAPQAIQSWFYPGDTTGAEFLYTDTIPKTDEIAALKSQIAEMRAAQAKQSEKISAVDSRAQKGLAEANRATFAATTANQIAAAADRIAANADQRSEQAQLDAKHSLSQLNVVAENIENRIASLDKYKVANQTTVTFEFNSDELNKEDMGKLDNVISILTAAQQGYLIELKGFTDGVGPEQYNLGLSDRRVESVMRYLVNKRVPLYRISLVGLGEMSPVANNQTAAGREQNRRVEVRVLRLSDTTATASR